jgi:hypothetical protein
VKHLKLLGLAVIAAMAFIGVSAAGAAQMYPEHQHSPGPELAFGLLFFSFITLGATALSIGKSRQITHCQVTGVTTNDHATHTVTGESPVQLSNSQKDRYAPPHISVMAC